MSINRNLAAFAKDVQSDGTLQTGSLQGIAVTVTVAGGVFVIDGTAQQDMFIPKGVKYRFDVSDSSVSGHPLQFSTTSDGTHGGGSAYTTGVTTSGTAGTSGAYVEVQLQQDAPDQLYYYCSNHSGMGAGAETAPVYTDSSVDTHLNTSTATSGQYLSWNGSDYDWASVSAGYTDSDVDTHLNTSTASASQYLQWNGSDYTWSTVSSGSSFDAVNVMGSRTVSSNTTISATESAFSVGPITIADGITVTVASGGRWVVI